VTRLGLFVAVLLAATAAPGCSTVSDFGIKGGPGFDINPFNLGSGNSVFSPANDRYFSDGDPQDCRTRH
jgi:hypothetical protein